MNFHVVKMEMSDFQFKIYEEARVQERKLELQNAKKKKRGGDNVYDDAVSTYRIFSRAFCNFVFPRPTILRPFPNDGATIETAITEGITNEDEFDAISKEEQALKTEAKIELDEAEEESAGTTPIFDNTSLGYPLPSSSITISVNSLSLFKLIYTIFLENFLKY